jgi:hypothetical protein
MTYIMGHSKGTVSSSSYGSTVQYGPWPRLMQFRNNNLFTWLDCYSSAQPSTWRTRSPYLWPPETGWPSYTSRHWVPILVAFYDMIGLQWVYSLIPATTRDDCIFSYKHLAWRSQWPRRLRRRSAAAWLLGSRLWFPLGGWVFVCCVILCR